MSVIDRTRNLVNTVRTTAQHAVEKTETAVSNAAHAVGNTVASTTQSVVNTGAKVAHAVDSFEKTTANKASALGNALFGKSDKPFDGAILGAGGQVYPPGTPLSQVSPVLPRNNPNPQETLVFVNGINTDKAGQAATMQNMADATGDKVIGLHNATEGMVADLAQCVQDKLDKGNNPAVDSLADTIYSELKAGHDLHLMAHSQGALVTSRALNHVEQRMRIEDGMSQADVEKAMGKVKVETFGGAAAHFPDGPQYVHYVNNKDIVPTWFGQGNGKGADDWLRDGGKGAVIRRFSDGSGITGSHSIDNMYLKHRIDFDAARAQGNVNP